MQIRVLLISLCIGSALLLCLFADFDGVALRALRHLTVIAACDMKLYVRVISIAVILLQFPQRIRIIDGFAETVLNVLLHSFVRLGGIACKCDGKMALIEHFASVFAHMLAVAKTHPPDRREHLASVRPAMEK